MENLAFHHGSQKDRLAVPRCDYLLFLRRRRGSNSYALEPDRTAGLSHRTVHVQQDVHSAWPGDDLLFSGAFDTRSTRQLSYSFDDWRERRRLSETESAQLVHLHGRWDGLPVFRHRRRRRGHRLDVLHSAQFDVRQLEGNVGGAGSLHSWYF